jgi:hypothetical protein
MKTFLMPIVLAGAVVFLSVAELGFVNNAEAIIGMPRIPLSVGGVARRSVYREPQRRRLPPRSHLPPPGLRCRWVRSCPFFPLAAARS